MKKIDVKFVRDLINFSVDLWVVYLKLFYKLY